MAMTFWLQLDAIDQSSEPKEMRIHSAVFRVMTILLPYQTQDQGRALSELEEQMQEKRSKTKTRK